MDQVICFDPWNQFEMKTKSFDAFRLNGGMSYRSFFGLGPSKLTRAGRPLVEDMEEKVDVFLPPPRKERLQNTWKLPHAADMVKHVLNGDRVPGMIIARAPEPGEEPGPFIIDLWADAELR